MIKETGIYNISDKEYFADPCIEASLTSSGIRNILNSCPAKYWHDLKNPQNTTESMKFGSLVHSILLNKDNFEDTSYILPEGFTARTKENKELLAKLKKENKNIVKEENVQLANRMLTKIEKNPNIANFFKDGKYEQTLVWQDEEFGIWCRAKLDYLPIKDNIIVDFKTTVSAHYSDIKKTIYKYKYYIQAAFYMEGIMATTDIENPTFVFVFQEKKAPFLTNWVTLSEKLLQRGFEEAREAKKIFKDCLKNNTWESYAVGGVI